MQPAEKRIRPWWFRTLRFLGILGLGLVTLVALLVAVENWRAERDWGRYAAGLRAAGERLTMAEIIPPMPPADQNLGALPVFQRLFEYQPGEALPPEGGVEGKAGFAVFRLPSVGSERNPGDPDRIAAFAAEFRSRATNAPGDELPSYPTPATGASDAEVVLTALSVADPLLAEICDAAGRPHAQFPIHYEESFTALLPHLAQIKAIQSHLRLRVAARLAAGQTNRAAADLDCAFRWAEVVAREPLLISQLVRFAQWSAVLATVNAGIRSGSWDDATLAEIQRRIRSWDVIGATEQAFEGERALANRMMDDVLVRPEMLAMLSGPEGPEAEWSGWKRVPRAIIRRNQIAINRCHTAVLGVLREPSSRSDLRATVGKAKAAQEAALPSGAGRVAPYRALAVMVLPATIQVVEKAARMQAVIALGDVACALERHRRAHGSHPDSLEQLDPRFLASPARDPLGSGLLNYRRLETGGYRLWSVGLDGRDDGGVYKERKSGPELDLPWPRSDDGLTLF